MEDHTAIPYLQEVIVFLVSAGVLVPLLHMLRVTPVLGYLIAGSVVGPFGLGLLFDKVPMLSYGVISELDGVKALAELGVIFLLFMIGLELSFERLWAMRRLVFGLGSLQVLITATIIGVIAFRFGNSVSASIVLGACLALSSTAIVMQLLIEGRRRGTPVGRASFAILLMQDLAVVPILFLVGFLGAESAGSPGADLALAVGQAILAIGLIYAVGRLILRPCLHLVARTRSPEMFMAIILLAVIGTSAITAAAGLSMALGAFLAGLLLAETEYRHEIEVDIEPFKGLMLGLFFMSVGMGIDWRLVGGEPFWIAASVMGLFALKSLLTAGLCLAFGMPRHASIEAGLLLGQGGEFAFIVVGLAMSLQVLSGDVGQFMLIVAGLTMFITPLVASAAERLSAYLVRNAPDEADLRPMADAEGLEGHVVLAGFGRAGRTLIDTLQAEAIPFIALDTDPAVVSKARAAKLPVYYGDASRLDILARVHIEHAAAVVITMNDPDATERSVGEIHRSWPFVEIYARARDGDQAARLLGAGASVVVPETIEASLQLAGRVLEGFGLSDEVVNRRLQHQRTVEETY